MKYPIYKVNGKAFAPELHKNRWGDDRPIIINPALVERVDLESTIKDLPENYVTIKCIDRPAVYAIHRNDFDIIFDFYDLTLLGKEK